MPESQAKFRFWWFFFSLKGRVTRGPYAAFLLSTRLLTEIAGFILGVSFSFENMALWNLLTSSLGLIGLLLLWPQFAILTKRLHDVGLPFWAGLLYFTPKLSQFTFLFWYAQTRLDPLATPGSVPLHANIWESIVPAALTFGVLLGLIVLAFIPGTQGRNRYGPHPHRPDRAASKVF